jgi:uncharacterized membrane protein YkvA (DUF1232 family)
MKPIKSLAVSLIGVVATLYLVNPGAGIFELIPDNLPLVGNLDEAAATALLLACLRYFGFDPMSLFKSKSKDDEPVIDVEGRRVP